MDIFKCYKKRLQLETDHAVELKRLKDHHQRVVEKILLDYNDQIGKNSRENDRVIEMMKRDRDVVNDELEKATNQIVVFEQVHDRVQRLLTKLEKRSSTYRAMMKAVAAWEEEIAIEREEDKIEEFIKWKNERQGEEQILT